MIDFADTVKEALFRTNPEYRLVPFDKLSVAQQKNILAHGLDPTAYGVFLPMKGSVLNVRAACAESALLFMSLRSPARMPQYVRVQNPLGWIDEINKLLLDEIIQIRIDNAYVSGNELLAHCAKSTSICSTESGPLLSSLSIQAILYAEKLDISDPRRLSERLYCYNRSPFCFDRHHYLCDRNEVAGFLRLTELEDKRLLNTHWKRSSQSPFWGGWLNFHSTITSKPKLSPDKWTCKLYISTPWQHLPQALLLFLLNAKSRVCAKGFKIPCDIFGLLRPDNFVIYANSKEALHELGASLALALHGIPVQGVPFSSPLTQDGLLSWGADPPKVSDHNKIVESWRLWLTNQLATNLIRAKKSDANLPLRLLALERLRLEGIDVNSWTPPEEFL